MSGQAGMTEQEFLEALSRVYREWEDEVDCNGGSYALSVSVEGLVVRYADLVKSLGVEFVQEKVP